MGFNMRLRRLLGVDAALSSSLRNAGRIDVYGTAGPPGPFELPPREPVRLAEPLPWELQDGRGAVADWVNRPEPG